MSEMTKQTVTFHDNTAAERIEIPGDMDPTYQLGRMDPVSLGQFLARPVKIYTTTWGVGSKIFETFDPYALFFDDPSVIEKYNHYAYMRAKLVIKCVVAGTPFHYGDGIVSWAPYGNRDDYSPTLSNITELVSTSQRPHFNTNPTESAGGEIKLPFFWHKSYWRIADREWEQMGLMRIGSYNTLKHAQGGNDPVSLVFYAWAEDLELMVPTTFSSVIPPPPVGTFKRIRKEADNESGSSDEYGKGIISKPAAAVENVASSLSAVPVIGKYARSTAMVAGTVGRLASWFGFSRPAILSDTMPYKPEFAGQMAVTDKPETVQRLVVDSKQELTIDSSVVGLASKEDPMAIATLLQTESYIDSFDWFPSDASDSLLWNARCTPTMMRRDTFGIYPSMMCYVALPFKYWRGGLQFRFRVVGSKLHRGRFRVSYDPLFHLGLSSYNQVYSKVVDISQETDFEFTVGWAQEVPFRLVDDIFAAGYQDTLFSNTTDLDGEGPYSNGVLKISVVNPLVEPGDTIEGVSVNVFVKAAPDFSLSRPRDLYLEKVSHFRPPVTGIRKEAGPDAQEGVGMAMSPDAGNAEHAALKEDVIGSNTIPTMYKTFFGEQVLSFRALLRRYVHVESKPIQGTSPRGSLLIATTRWDNYPKPPGYALGLGGDLNRNRMVLWNYLAPVYLGARGALRYKYVLLGQGTGQASFTAVTDDITPASGFAVEWTAGDPYPAGRSQVTTVSGFAGKTLTPARLQNVLEVEVPFYTNMRMRLTRYSRSDDPLDPDAPERGHATQVRGFLGSVDTANPNADINPRGIIDRYMATGEDFTFLWPMCAPTIYERTYSYDQP